MWTLRLAPTIVLLLILGSRLLCAQGPGLKFYAYGGGYTPFADLTPAGDLGFKTGFNLGAGTAIAINRFLEIRGDLTLVRSRERGTVTEDRWRKLFSGADVVFKVPVGKLALRVSAGGGVVTMDEEVPDSPLSSRRAGRFGAGISYGWSRNLELLAQGALWIYKWDGTKYPTYTQRQLDAVYSVGLSYKIPFGHGG
ncbi:MAG: hypothetical protein KatS3mg081_1561 [Gemmatimonadales bacterium]|nr:hypothetical protein HRbin33_00775 [bacterium HR33]GIW52206.1 MAG: hypothetical protein KatS3mg081_1561 [Gemmatimonadales bacterium]